MMAPAADERELVFTMTLSASRANVYRACTEPELLKQWFAPKPLTTPVVELDVRRGGDNFVVVRMPDGQEMAHRRVYLEVVPNERLVFTDAYVSAWVPSAKPFMTFILTFEDEGQGTRYTARAQHWSAADREAHEKMGFHSGWEQRARQLEAVAAGL